ncbi:hypothetical protein CC79DRAFT_1319205 [Sarocladium strictum]
MSVLNASTMADQHNLPVVSDLTADRVNHIRPEEINYDIYANKYLHLTSEPDTARRDMAAVPYDSQSRADDLFWAAAVDLYEEKVKFLPKHEADLYIDLCLLTHIWHGHTHKRMGQIRIYRDMAEAKECPSFAHVLIFCLLYGFESLSKRMWFRDWHQKFKPYQSMPHVVEGISDVENQPEPRAGWLWGIEKARSARNEKQYQIRHHPIQLIKPTAPKRRQAPARQELLDVFTEVHDPDYYDSAASARMATKRARVPGFFDERELTSDNDLPDDTSSHELNRKSQSEKHDSFMSEDQTADTLIMDESDEIVIPDKVPMTSQHVSASFISLQSEGQVTQAEAKYLHERASAELAEIDQELKRVTKEIAQYERQISCLQRDRSDLTERYGKVKARVVHWEVAEVGSV